MDDSRKELQAMPATETTDGGAVEPTVEKAPATGAGNGNGAGKSASGGAVPSTWDRDAVVEALVREKNLRLTDAQQVAKATEEEIAQQGLTNLPPETVRDLVETKLLEMGLVRGVKPQEKTAAFFTTGPQEWSENCLTVLRKRYLLKDSEGKVIETPDELFHRVANAIAAPDDKFEGGPSAEDTAREFYRIMTRREFMPNSPTLMNAGKAEGQLSACFVLPVEDSMEGIFDTMKHAAIIHKTGGGTGFAFSRLRPRNDMVQSTKGISSGPLSFLDVYNSATEAVKQGGTRRGANMGILRVNHPDIEDFIHYKEDRTKLTNFNVSVGITGEFMKAVEDDTDYALINPRSKEVVKRLNARHVFREIVESAWESGEPGIVFLDRINADNPTPHIGEIESTNPCGEQPLLPYEACNLGSLNLAKVYMEDEQGNPGIDWDKLRDLTHTCIHFLDNVIEANHYPLPQIEEMVGGNRKIGLGVMGWADLLIMLGVSYCSDEAVELAEKICKFMREEADKASAELAEIRGPFPNFTGSALEAQGYPPLRNSTRLTIAPTGTISIIAGASGGVEPLFAVSYIRNVMDNTELVEVNPLFERIAKERGFYSDDLMKRIAKQGHLGGLEEIPDDVRRVFVTAHDVTPEWHVRMQAAWQKYTDNAVSKTVNFPKEATVEHVAEVYQLAHRLGCKGVTVYRDQSRDAQVLNIGKVNRDDTSTGDAGETPAPDAETPALSIVESAPAAATSTVPADAMHGVEPRDRGEVTVGATRKVMTGCGNLYVTINEDQKGLVEVFTAMGKAGGCANSQAEATSRMISLALRAGVSEEAIIKQLRGISCPNPAWQNGEMVMSCADGISKALEAQLASKGAAERAIVEKLEAEAQKTIDRPAAHLPMPSTGPFLTICPDCSSKLEFESGCVVCRGCGFSKCS